MRGDRALYELYILPWKGQQRLSLWTVAVGSQLLLSYYKDGINIGTGGVSGGDGGVVENESPKLKLALYELPKLGYKLL